ncbi:MAG: hypothetical protein QG553_579 [Patescibacteria group bacterium]|nr:hypothetical protein [Patescibacteria group bacterium]
MQNNEYQPGRSERLITRARAATFGFVLACMGTAFATQGAIQANRYDDRPPDEATIYHNAMGHPGTATNGELHAYGEKNIDVGLTLAGAGLIIVIGSRLLPGQREL